MRVPQRWYVGHVNSTALEWEPWQKEAEIIIIKKNRTKTKQKSLNYSKYIEQNESSNKNVAVIKCLNDYCRCWCEFSPKMLAVDSLNLMFQIKSLETNKWAAYWVANLHNLRDVGQSSWVATDTFPVQRDTYYQTSFRWRNIWALGRMGSFLRARSGHRMVQKPYKDSGNHRLRPDKDPDLVGVYKNHVSHKSKLDETTTAKWKIQFT